MSRAPGREPRKIEVTIEKVVYGGSGLGRHQGKVVFVPFAAPGDRLEVEVVREKKRYIEAAILRILESSAERTDPFCGYFGTCGGCQWQHLRYERQVEHKARVLEELFHHHFPETRQLPIRMTASPQSVGYRSRARVQLRGFLDTTIVGFYRYRSHRVQDIDSCPLFQPLLNEALRTLRSERRQGLSDPAVRQAELAASPESGRWSWSPLESTLEEESFPVEGVGGSGNRSEVLERTLAENAYFVSPSTFFQANDSLVGDLVRRVAELAQVPGRAAALDLFAGVGLFSIPLARRFETVVAVENSPTSSDLCARNARRAGMENLHTVCADVEQWMKAVNSAAPPAFDLVLLDPPRGGAGTEIARKLTEWGPGHIVFAGCDPHTLVRDLSILVPGHYEVDSVEGFDLFPQTYHFETVVRLRHR